MDIMDIKGDTRVLGIFGYPIRHTLSPLMHNVAIREKGLNIVYLPFEVEKGCLKEAVQAVRALNLLGVNVTIPHKEAVMPFLDEVSEEAILSGSVNTIVNMKGRLKGFNTDGEGYIRSLQRKGFNVNDKRVLMLGAGGAARGITASLIKEKVGHVVIANRTPLRGEELAKRFSHISLGMIEAIPLTFDSLRERIKDIDLIVNTTSVEMEGKGRLKIPLNLLPKGAIVSDIVYKPFKTPLLKDAEALGYKTINGIGMLVEQGALSFKLWTGIDAPVRSMEMAVIKALQTPV